ncbi:MAG TPA: wax ester/triacylglycerol synthase domain-containing protein [Acidimicrobiales bacterium]
MSETPPVEDRHMTDAEALMWNLEKDPLLRSDFGNVTIVDRNPDTERMRGRLDAVAGAFPRLRRRVQPTFGRLAPPRWSDDPSFDVDYHVRRVGVPGTGTERDLLDLAAAVLEDPFDRTRPLWRFWLVEGLADGHGAVIQQMHHTITDGEGGVRMSAMMLDLERDAIEPMMPIPEPADDGGPVLDEGRGPLAGAREALVHNARRQVGVARRTAEEVIDRVRDPRQLPSLAADAVATVQSLRRQLDSDSAHSPLWTSRSLSRRLVTTRVPLDDARRAAKGLGGTVNDFFVTGAAAAAGDYHRRLDHPTDELRISMPVSTRSKGSNGGNAFAPTRVLVPTGEMDPAERFELVHDRLTTTKTERAIGVTQSLAGLVNLLPTSMLVDTARRMIQTVDFAVSNVRGAPFDLYMGGAKILANYPVGPTGGTAFNLTLLSSGGSLDMCLNCDCAAVGQPALLVECLGLAYDELVAAGSGA